uniref:Uncharacterized protein n=1 Tax=Setaria italica TaxID=4555 RepID=K3XR78_SETIT
MQCTHSSFSTTTTSCTASSNAAHGQHSAALQIYSFILELLPMLRLTSITFELPLSTLERRNPYGK